MRTKQYSRNATYDQWASGTERDCIRCGKYISDPRFWVHIINGGDAILHRDDEAKYVSDDSDLGMHPIGPECAKTIGANYITEEIN